MDQMDLTQLLREREKFTQILKEAKCERTNLDLQIIDIMQAKMDFVREGVHELSTDDGPRVIVKTALSRSVSAEDVNALNVQLRSESLDPEEELQGVFKPRFDIDLKQLRDIEANNKPLYGRICRIITSKPRAPALTVKDIQE